MADTTAKTTTTPRKRAASTTRAATTRKAPAAKAAPKTAPAEEEAENGHTVITFQVPHTVDTKSYAKFDLATDVDGNATGCVGSVYAPLGTEVVKVRLEGPADALDAE